MQDPVREFLRHMLATVAYRGAKAVRGAPESFAQFGAGPEPRTPVQILAHIGDLMDWSLTLLEGRQKWRASVPLAWDQEVTRVFTSIQALDAYLASGEPLRAPVERLFQGPIADALTHVGQLAMLRRMAGAPMRGENYFVAGIQAGRTASDQAPPVMEFS
jgi:hypothetical protein